MSIFNGTALSQYYVDELLLKENQPEWIWHHCYQYFASARYQELHATDYNMLSLHLSVYLAQENMYRGSSFILQNGYKIHREAIKLICSPRYHVLSGISFQDLAKSNNLALLFELTEAISLIYTAIRERTYLRLNKVVPQSPVSQSLLTKILLGTLACVPAFDGKSLLAFKKFEISPQHYSVAAVNSLLRFYQREKLEFVRMADNLSQRHLSLPDIKLIDMVLQYAGEDCLLK